MTTFLIGTATESGGLRGALTALATLAFVAVCFASIALVDRRGQTSGASRSSASSNLLVDEPAADAWPMHTGRGSAGAQASRRSPEAVVAICVGGSVAALVVAAVLIPVRDSIGLASVALALVLVVIGAAAAGGRVPAAVVSAVAALCFNFLHTAPLYTFHIADTQNVVTSALMILIGLSVGEVAQRRPARGPGLASSPDRGPAPDEPTK